MTRIVFNVPPGWPPSPPGWLPPAGWTAPSEWPAPPADWVMYLESPSEEQDAALAELRCPQREQEDSWWGEGGGYHAAYFTSPRLANPDGVGSSLRNAPRSPLAPAVARGRRWALMMGRGWPRRLVIAAGALCAFLMFLSFMNNPVTRAISACESAIASESERLVAQSGQEGAAYPDELLEASAPNPIGYARSDIRYALAPSGDPGVVAIVGDYSAMDGTWATFTCTARHNPGPPEVMDVVVAPLVPVPISSAP